MSQEQLFDLQAMLQKYFSPCGECPQCGGTLWSHVGKGKQKGINSPGACPSCGYKEPLNAKPKIRTAAEMTALSRKKVSVGYYLSRSVFSNDMVMAKDFNNFEVVTPVQKSLRALADGVVNQLLQGKTVHSFIGGSTGIGKTHIANAIALAYQERSQYKAKVMFVDWREILDRQKRGMDTPDVRAKNQATIDEWSKADLVVLDDLGSERNSEYNLDMCDRFWRVREDKSVITTSNVMIEEIRAKYGERTYSRLRKWSKGNSIRLKESKDQRGAEIA